jgi:hypothetical protein
MGKVNASIYKVALFLGVFLAYVVVNDVHWHTAIETPQASVEVQLDSTPGHNIFNPDTKLDTSQVTVIEHGSIVPCDTDTDCVVKNPQIIPDANTWDDYLRVYGDNVQFPTKGDCSRVDWFAQDEDGRFIAPVDLDNDGIINCSSDMELGS